MNAPTPFWETKTLDEMSRDEWESLCDGCGRCCLHKLRDEDDESLHYTSVACRLLDVGTGLCTDYPNRLRKVQDCITLTADLVRSIDWLPPTCAYRLLAEHRPLPIWHPLVTGRAESVQEAGISVAGRCISERQAGTLENYLVQWPAQDPTGAVKVPRKRHVSRRNGR